MRLSRSADRLSELGKVDWFTGNVWLDEIAIGEPPSNLRVHSVTFTPGARTRWHTHPLGQALHVLSGVGRIGVEGRQVYKVGPGDNVWIAPGERHWHGAAPDHVFVHIAVQEATSEGHEADWFEPVNDEDYRAGPSA